MTEYLRKNMSRWVVAMGIILAGLLAGCQSSGPLPNETVSNTYHVGDSIQVTGITPTYDQTAFPPVVQSVREDGTITLPLIGSITAAGKTAGELQKAIHDAYVPKYFPDVTLSIKGEVGFFFVDGEVNQRGQKEYAGEQMTIVKAITAAGGFTDFAKETKVRLTRGTHTQIINVKKAITDPKYDVRILPGDKIHVPRRILW
jgi:polysaccharide export outer membrane protein